MQLFPNWWSVYLSNPLVQWIPEDLLHPLYLSNPADPSDPLHPEDLSDPLRPEDLSDPLHLSDLLRRLNP
jgi:hypothetical protein